MLIAAGDLNQAQQVLWQSLLDVLTQDQAEAVLMVLKKYPEILPFLTENLQQKYEAFRTGDISAWEAILDSEQQFMATL